MRRRRSSTDTREVVGLGSQTSLVLLLLIATLNRVLVEGTSSLSPLSIGIRSAIAKGPLGYYGTSRTVPSSQHYRASSLNRIGDRTSGEVVSPFKNDEEYLNLQREDELCLTDIVNRGGAAAVATPDRRLHFWEAMVCGAISRSAAQTIMHPANTMKTILQSSRKVPGKAPLTVRSFTQMKHAKHLTRGAGAQLILSIPHGAVNFAVLEFVRRQMNNVVSQSRYADTINRNFGPGMVRGFLCCYLFT